MNLPMLNEELISVVTSIDTRIGCPHTRQQSQARAGSGSTTCPQCRSWDLGSE